ncbi:MAG: hypothetical protein RL513_501 [Pseudomonadota bacterium]|jgi:hypothetical protein
MSGFNWTPCVRIDDPDREGWKMIVCSSCADDLHVPEPRDIAGMLPTFRCERCVRTVGAEVQS